MSLPLASQRLWLTVDNEVVFEDDPAARFLLVAEGQPIPDGYTEPKAARKAEDKAVGKTDDKAVRRAFDK